MRVLISVSDKGGIVDFAKRLVSEGCTILSTGGTARLLSENGIPVTPVEEFTGQSEILDGRVKTLHPAIHGGILARDDQLDELRANGMEPISMVVCNLYPFSRTVAGGAELEEAIEQIDVGGVTLLRAAAKNHGRVTVVCYPSDYDRVGAENAPEIRRELALKAFRHTAAYDDAIDDYLTKEFTGEEATRLTLRHGRVLRYGENPHQKARFFRTGEGIGSAEQLHGKQLSYNNYLDGDAALAIASELRDAPAAVVVKHTNPCGIATGKTLRDALEAAWSGDVVSAFGSVIALSREVDLRTAEFLRGKFVEMVVAPSYADDALAFLKEKSKNIRILVSPVSVPPRTDYRSVSGGILEQESNDELFREWKCVTKTRFPEGKEKLAAFIGVACKHTKSNAVILGIEYASGCFKVLGMGAGQPNRVDSLRKLAVTKAQENIEREGGSLTECVLVSDAFFPFDDTVRAAAEMGVRLVVQPGGSIRDDEVIAACNELGVAMVFTGTRHFKH